MHYHVSRNGQMYGPYTLEDLQRYLASGNILATDLAKTDEMTEWVPVSEVVGGIPPVPTAEPGYNAAPGYGAQAAMPDPYLRAGMMGQGTPAEIAASPYPDPPNLNWGLVILFTVLTCGLFMIIWNIIVSAWLRRIQPNANAMMFYIAVVVLGVINLIIGGAASMHHLANGTHAQLGPDLAVRGLLGLAIWVIRLIARYSERASLEEHYNGPEPLGLRLDGVMTFFFGGVYFQYHLNRINEMKQAARFAVSR